ncbi:hypothetical protein CsSME_00050649 [Camellia sinensis var. sinensis]
MYTDWLQYPIALPLFAPQTAYRKVQRSKTRGAWLRFKGNRTGYLSCGLVESSSDVKLVMSARVGCRVFQNEDAQRFQTSLVCTASASVYIDNDDADDTTLCQSRASPHGQRQTVVIQSTKRPVLKRALNRWHSMCENETHLRCIPALDISSTVPRLHRPAFALSSAVPLVNHLAFFLSSTIRHLLFPSAFVDLSAVRLLHRPTSSPFSIVRRLRRTWTSTFLLLYSVWRAIL